MDKNPEANFFCRNCAALFDSKQGDGPCPSPSPGRPMVDCGKGGHWFEEAKVADRFCMRDRFDFALQGVSLIAARKLDPMGHAPHRLESNVIEETPAATVWLCQETSGSLADSIGAVKEER